MSSMCGRFTYRLTWEEIVRLYRLTLDQPAQNTHARYNVCPTTTIDTIVEREASASSPACVGASCRHGGRNRSRN
jgi:putative SOS response-associated peptidase YedK